MLNALGVDAANIGNHEFNYGLPFLRQAIAGANFPYVSANVTVDDGDGNPANDKPAFTPYVILERSVHRRPPAPDAPAEDRRHRLRAAADPAVGPRSTCRAG